MHSTGQTGPHAEAFEDNCSKWICEFMQMIFQKVRYLLTTGMQKFRKWGSWRFSEPHNRTHIGWDRAELALGPSIFGNAYYSRYLRWLTIFRGASKAGMWLDAAAELLQLLILLRLGGRTYPPEGWNPMATDHSLSSDRNVWFVAPKCNDFKPAGDWLLTAHQIILNCLTYSARWLNIKISNK